MRNIILCGFMGCGKTTVGKHLASLSKRQFIDMDAYIEQQAGMTVGDIFECFGENDFRNREREVCAALAQQEDLVIASGGGALTFSENIDALSASGDIVFLDVPLDAILCRLRNDMSRPLLACSDKEQAAKQLYDRRLPLYRAAATFIVSGVGTPSEIAQSIVETLKIEL